MSKQIAVRLPEDLVEFLDQLVEHGEATSRASAVVHALERERRRLLAEHDIAILRGSEPDADLDALARFAATTPMNDLD